jgi:Flp pilus assembly pilin Flp
MRLHSNEDGQAIVEYGLVIGALSLALIAVFIVTGLDASFTALVQKIQAAFNKRPWAVQRPERNLGRPALGPFRAPAQCGGRPRVRVSREPRGRGRQPKVLS